MVRAVKQGSYLVSKHRYKMKISIKTFGYAVKFDVRQKKEKKSMGLK